MFHILVMKSTQLLKHACYFTNVGIRQNQRYNQYCMSQLGELDKVHIYDMYVLTHSITQNAEENAAVLLFLSPS